MTLNDSSWEERCTSLEHHRWYARIRAIHELTLAWLEALEAKPQAYGAAASSDPGILEELPLLERLLTAPIDELLDDTRPEDLLARLEHAARVVQAAVLAGFLKGGKLPEAAASTLEQTSWKLGRKQAEAEWKGLHESRKSDLRALIQGTTGTPPHPRPDSLLIRRALAQEAFIELRDCVHTLPESETGGVADLLCSLQLHWLRGYAYGMSPRVAVEALPPGAGSSGRCHQRWTLIQNPNP